MACIFRASSRFSPREIASSSGHIIGSALSPTLSPLETTYTATRSIHDTSSSLAGANQRVTLLSPSSWAKKSQTSTASTSSSRDSLHSIERVTRDLHHSKALPFSDSPIWHRRRSPRTLNLLVPPRTLVKITSTTLVLSPLQVSYTRTKTRPLLCRIPQCRSA